MDRIFFECLLNFNIDNIIFLNKFRVLNKSSYEVYKLYKRDIYINSYYLNDYFIDYLGLEYDYMKDEISTDKFNWKIIVQYFDLINLQINYYHIRKSNIYMDSLLSLDEKFNSKANDPFNPKRNLIKLKKIYINSYYLNRERIFALRKLNTCKRDNKYIYSIIF